MRVSESGDRVVALLIGDDENDIGAFHRVRVGLSKILGERKLSLSV